MRWNMTRRTEPFRKAILNSLTDIEARGEKITQAVIIKHAKFDDGRSVGKTTLYKKNKTTGEYVHEDLLKKIEQAVNLQCKRKGAPTKTETIESLKLQKKELQDEISKLVDQVVEQEQKLNQVQTGMDSDRNTVKSQEAEVYVLSALLKYLAPKSSNAEKHARDVVIKYEQKNRGASIIDSANLEIEEYIRDINYSTLISFSDDKKRLK